MANKSLNGHRAHVILTTPQLKRLKQLSKNTGLTVSEILRRAVDAYITKQETPQ